MSTGKPDRRTFLLAASASLMAVGAMPAADVFTRGGPWVIAMWTDSVLGDPMLIRWSIAVVATALFIGGAAIIATGLKRRG